MASKKTRLLAAAALLTAAVLLCAALTLVRSGRFARELISQFDTAAVTNEVHAARLRMELQELGSAAALYKSSKEKMLELTERRLKAYSEELLVLVNPWNAIDEDYTPELSTVEDGYRVDRRCADALTKMLFDCREAGHFPVICSAYRTQEYQQELFDKKIQRIVATGVSRADAPAIAARSVAVPGTSEHQLGLAVDLIDYFYTNLDEGQERTGTQKWLMEHCADYGFILRYPNGSSEITGIIYEPWHYRYVGKTVAREITDAGITFEEYLQARQEK